jgi:succinyl-CoA synthetase beta subunit
MKAHEFRAKEMLARYGIPTPRGRATHNSRAHRWVHRIAGDQRPHVEAAGSLAR